MKQVFSLILVGLLCLGMCACGAAKPQATEPVGTTAATEPAAPSIDSIMKNAVLQYPANNELFKYNVYDTYVEITEYLGADDAEEVTVPAILEDLPVYKVDSGVFEKCKVKSIVFEEGIYRINSDFSFYVERVTLPATLDFVGYGTFENCHNLKEVVIPEGIDSIQTKAFMHCDSLTEITIPSTVTSLDQEVFAYCSALETVNLPEGLKRIEDQAFLSCKSLKSLTIPGTVEKLGDSVFQGSGLESIEIPESVQEMGSGAFTACEDLLVVKVYNADMKILPLEGYTVAILFSQCNPKLVVHGKPASTIAKACATEDVFFEVMK